LNVDVYNIQPVKVLGLLKAFKESADWAFLLSFCDDSNLHISIFKQLVSTKMGGFGWIDQQIKFADGFKLPHLWKLVSYSDKLKW